MHIIPMVQEQHAIYFGYAFLGVLGKFYRNRKGLMFCNYFSCELCSRYFQQEKNHAPSVASAVSSFFGTTSDPVGLVNLCFLYSKYIACSVCI